MTDIVNLLRQTRADMLGTDDEEHYWACHEAADEIVRLREAMSNLKAVFRINMLRAFPEMSHEAIDAEIAKALGETNENP